MQALALEDAGEAANIMILLDVNDEILTDRVLGRRSDPETGEIYHMTTNPPPNDEVAARLVSRSDDTEEVVKVRLENYHANIDSVIGVYEGVVTSATVAAASGVGSESDADFSASESEVETEAEAEVEVEVKAEVEAETPEVVEPVPENEPVVDSSIPAALAATVSRVFKVNGDRDPLDITHDIFGRLREITNSEGQPTTEEKELAHGATMIQGVFRTRQAKKVS